MKIKAFVIQVTDSNGVKTFLSHTDPSMEPMVFYSKKIAKDFAKTNNHLELPALNPLSLKVKKATLKVKSKGKKPGKNDKK